MRSNKLKSASDTLAHIFKQDNSLMDFKDKVLHHIGTKLHFKASVLQKVNHYWKPKKRTKI